MINIYICDDNAVYLRYVHDFIENYAKDRPFRITDCGSADELLAAVETQPADIAVLDISLGLVVYSQKGHVEIPRRGA